MKLSLSWIFDHIDADWRTISVPDLITQFTSTVAELDHVEALELDLATYTLACIISIEGDFVIAKSPEWNTEYTLPMRPGAKVKQWYLLYRNHTSDVRWATLIDIGGHKDGFMPALICHKDSYAGAWKQGIEIYDYILDIDNKSISNRPDLWGHRGCAREIAAMLKLPFIAERALLADLDIRFFDDKVSATAQSPIGITLKDTDACKRFAGMYIQEITAQASDLRIASRLARVDVRPLNCIVDVTNYVMFDLGQPLHAYDAARISTGMLMPKYACSGEKLQLLDGQNITLSDQDLVISDGQQPIGLAGVMGGASTAISNTTTQVFFEAACFDPVTVRHGATRHKLRTEASARFEKSLDPEQTAHALARVIKILRNLDEPMIVAPYLAVLGKKILPLTLSVDHTFIETSLGITLEVSRVEELLVRLGFLVTFRDGRYTIEVPSFRATKDVTLANDIVEEVGRSIGYQSITPVLPMRATKPMDATGLYRMRRMKYHLAHALCMRELSSYAFFDEQFLRELGWQPANAVEVANPLSEQWYRLVTSLIPTMIRAVVHTSAEHDRARFFECAKIWMKHEGVIERSSLAGIMFDKKNPVNFYEMQRELITLFDLLGIHQTTWESVDKPEQPWFMPHQTADILIDGCVIGRAGNINPLFMHAVVEGDAAIFELDAAFLKHFKPAVHRYQPLSKYPDIVRDISIFISIERMAADLKNIITAAHTSIVTIDLIDFFHKAEWGDRKSLTFRYTLRDTTKTLTKHDADVVTNLIVDALRVHGAEIR